MTERADLFAEREQTAALVVQLPIHPAERIVLAIAVVIALLSAAALVTVREHRGALGQEQRRQQVALLFRTQRSHLGIIRRTFYAAVERQVVVVPVAVFLAVGLVVFTLVGDQIGEREAVVAGH